MRNQPASSRSLNFCALLRRAFSSASRGTHPSPSPITVFFYHGYHTITNTHTPATMKFAATIVATGLLATASAFSPSSAGFTTQTYNVGERTVGPMQQQGTAHSQRRATIVMDGKANGALSRRIGYFRAHICYSVEQREMHFDRARDGLFSDRRQRKRHSMVQEESTYVGISTISTGSRNFGAAFP